MARKAASSWTRLAGPGWPSGVEEQGMYALGFPRNLGDPAVPAEEAVPEGEGDGVEGKGGRESECLIVPMKPGNRPQRDSAEGRGRWIKQPSEGNVPDIPWSVPTSTRLERIAKLAKQMPETALTSLSHHLDLDFMKEAYRRTRKDGAVGVDGQTAADYEANLEENLRSLLDRAKSGRYRAPPVRRVRIPKGDGKETRPIGIPTLEDKVLQRAVAMLLEAVYEQDFLNCSYGFRPGRSAHQALETIWKKTMAMGGGWVVEVDIRKFFDTLDHGHIRELLSLRVRDGVVLRLVGKWLNAGVMEDGELSFPDAGTPQGGVISPLIANVYLHHVLDRWWTDVVQPRMAGRSFLARYADDFVIGVEHERDADRIMAVLPQRFARYGLEIHPTKTRKVDFRAPGSHRDSGPEPPEPQTFDFLGFTHHWDKSRKGNWIVRKKTAASRLNRTLVRLNLWCKRNRHEPVKWQHGRLSQSLRGHYSYFGVTGNIRALKRLHHMVERIWRNWLNRRSWRSRMPWERFQQLLGRLPLPPPRIVHSIYGAAKA